MPVTPRTTRGPIADPFLVDCWGRPRYWGSVWALLLPADMAESTLRSKLAHIECFYKHVDEVFGPGRLDDALADCDVELLSSALEAYFIGFRNLPVIPATAESRWQAALRFVFDTVQRVTRSNSNQNSACEHAW